MQQPRFLKWSLIFAIAIVANLFANYALSLVYKAPTWDKFCPQGQVVTQPTTEAECVSAGGQWTTGQKDFAGYCNPNYTCQMDYQSAWKVYERNVFMVLVAFGVILIVLSFVISAANAVVKTALSLGGSLSLVVASVRYWGEAEDWLRVVILGVALIALLYLAIRKFSEKVRS